MRVLILDKEGWVSWINHPKYGVFFYSTDRCTIELGSIGVVVRSCARARIKLIGPRICRGQRVRCDVTLSASRLQSIVMFWFTNLMNIVSFFNDAVL